MTDCCHSMISVMVVMVLVGLEVMVIVLLGGTVKVWVYGVS